MSEGGDESIVRLYQPWPAPVQAACYRDRPALVEIRRWVERLRAQGRISPDLRFSVGERDGDPVGIITDLTGEQQLRRGEFLVFGHSGLRVLDQRSFFRRYHDPGGPPIPSGS